ncbi:hypothetical protein SCLCIDRAFT_1221196 [Scleroderma citrinum Foug A]|uniref:Uncharacterized protein n=1 Tax=Scleroderma citrinum Foug A TaxID=1036808 RepID=A0A0C3D3K0_9AGAM|nr:hypothetical protein SCLCIDRAFT_1221196 [Scleroderma citrinum Foug A]
MRSLPLTTSTNTITTAMTTTTTTADCDDYHDYHDYLICAASMTPRLIRKSQIIAVNAAYYGVAQVTTRQRLTTCRSTSTRLHPH